MKRIKHDFFKEFKKVDLSITPARIAAMAIFDTHNSPIDAQHVINHLQKDLGIDRVTVFRILKIFTEKNLIKKLEFGEGKARYELNKNEHHHLICKKCGKIEDILDCHIKIFTKDIRQKSGFIVKDHSLEFFGICKDCQK